MATSSASARPKTFRLNVDDDVLEDLRSRLHSRNLKAMHDFKPPSRVELGLSPNVRTAVSYADESKPGSGSPEAWRYGMDVDFLEQLLAYFEGEFLDKWRETEEKLNEFPQYTVEVEPGIELHYIHARCDNNADALTIFLLHGWPSTIYDHQKVVPLLLAAGFDVVVPSIPGFGFSTVNPSELLARNTGVLRTAILYEKLAVNVLQLPAYAVQGGDWGAAIASTMASRSPRCVALHLNLPIPIFTQNFSLININKLARLSAYLRAPTFTLDSRERGVMENIMLFLSTNTAYFMQHTTKPATLGHAMRESPAGLAAWVMEKFYVCSDFRKTGKLFDTVTMDEILTTVMMFWVTDSAGTAMAFYRHSRNFSNILPDFISVPTAVLTAPCEPLQLPQSLMELSYDVRRHTVLEEGGHFLPLEQPRALANDLIAFLKEDMHLDEQGASTLKQTRTPLSNIRLFQASLPFLAAPLAAVAAYAFFRNKL